MVLRRVAVVVLLGVAAVVFAATPAAAHAELVGSDPADGASVAAAPTRVQLTFNEPVTPAPDAVEVVGPDNVAWAVGTPSVAGAVVTVPVRPSGPAGRYQLVYRVVSGDGDAVSGSIAFTLTSAASPPTSAPATPTSSPATDATATSRSVAADEAVDEAVDDGAQGDGDGVPTWVWIVAAAVVALAGVGIALRGRRTGKS